MDKAKEDNLKVTWGRGYANESGRRHIGFGQKRITAPSQWTGSDQQQA